MGGLARYKQTVLSPFRGVEHTLAAVQMNKARHEVLKRQVVAANLTRTRYEESMTSFLEVLDIESALFSSELGAADTQEQYVTAVVKLFIALGGGWNPGQGFVSPSAAK